MCSVTIEENEIKKELDDNRCKLIDSIDRAEVLLRCLKKIINTNNNDNNSASNKDIR